MLLFLIKVGGKLLLEGVLKVYWGLRKPVTLAGHRLGDWRRRSQKDHSTKSGKGATESREKSSFVSVTVVVINADQFDLFTLDFRRTLGDGISHDMVSGRY